MIWIYGMTDNIKLEPKIKKMFDEALELRDKKEYENAAHLLKQIVKQAPEVPFCYGHLGEIAWRQGKLQEANLYFRKTTKLLPKSSLASLGVFHTLWEMRKYESALREIERFEKEGGKCEDYCNIVAGLIKGRVIDKDYVLLQEPTSPINTYIEDDKVC